MNKYFNAKTIFFIIVFAVLISVLMIFRSCNNMSRVEETQKQKVSSASTIE